MASNCRAWASSYGANVSMVFGVEEQISKETAPVRRHVSKNANTPWRMRQPSSHKLKIHSLRAKGTRAMPTIAMAPAMARAEEVSNPQKTPKS